MNKENRNYLSMGYEDGLREFKVGNYHEASEEFIACTEADEHNHKAWNALGICLSKMGEYEGANQCFENAISISPNNETYRKNFKRNEVKLKKSEPDLELPDDEPTIINKASNSDSVNHKNLISQIIGITKSLFNNPHEFFRSTRDDDWKDSYKYVIVLSIPVSILYGITSSLISGFNDILLTIFGTFIGFLIVPLIYGLFLYVATRILRGNRGINNAMNITIYSEIPLFLFIWIPIIGGIIGLVSLYWEIVGLKVLEGFSTMKAILALFISGMASFILVIIPLFLLSSYK